MKKILVLLIIGLCFIVGCSKKRITELEKIIEKDNYIIVDVRTNSEYIESHIKKAINIPVDEIDNNIGLDKSKTILVYCKSGVRSNRAYLILKELGYDVLDLGAFDSIDLEKE